MIEKARNTAIKFDEQSFFSSVLGFAPGWYYKHYNKYISQKNVNLSTTNKIQLIFDCIDGSVVDGLRQPILCSFLLDKLPGYKVFCEPETIHYKTANKSVLNTSTFSLEDDKHKEVDLNSETLSFALQILKFELACLHTII